MRRSSSSCSAQLLSSCVPHPSFVGNSFAAAEASPETGCNSPRIAFPSHDLRDRQTKARDNNPGCRDPRFAYALHPLSRDQLSFLSFFSHVVTHRVTPATTSRRKFNGSQQVRTALKTHRCGSRYPIFLCACLVSQLSEKGSGRIGYRCYVSTTMLRAAERPKKKRRKHRGRIPLRASIINTNNRCASIEIRNALLRDPEKHVELFKLLHCN